jgi:ribonuclease P protein component
VSAAETKGRRRLSRAAEFDAVYRRGRSAASRHLVVYVFPRESSDRDEARFGMSISRKVGGAVERNKVKRLLREAFTLEAERVDASWDEDVVVVARPDARDLADREGLAGVRAALAELLARAAGAERHRPDASP